MPNEPVKLSAALVDDLFAGLKPLPDGWDVNPRLIAYRPLTDPKGAFVAFGVNSRKYSTDTPFYQMALESRCSNYVQHVWPQDKRWNHCHDRWAQKPFDARRYFGQWDIKAEALSAEIVADTIRSWSLKPYSPIGDQGSMLEAIYRLVFPDWDRIQRLDGWPACNKDTWKEISRRFMAFDRRYHPDVLAGGAWMNNGFSSHNNEDLPDWSVRRCPVTYQEAVA